MNRFFKCHLIVLSSLMIFSCSQGNNNENSKDNPTLENITISGDYETEFEVFDDFNYDGLIVTAHYSDKTEMAVVPQDVSYPDMTTVGEKEVVVTYETVTASYTINVSEVTPYEGYIILAFYHLDIALNDNEKHYLNPVACDFTPNPDLNMPYTFDSSDETIASVTKNGGVYSSKNKIGQCVITVTADNGIKATCTITVMEQLPVKQKIWKQVNDYDSLKSGDILVFAAPTHGVTASLNTLHSKLNVVSSSFCNNYQNIDSLGEGTIEFALSIEDKGMTLESQTGEYLKCTHEGKVTLDSSLNTNRFWDIHSNVDPDTGEGSINDGAVIENNVESLGYFMFNVSANYFSTYVDNSLRPNIMELPFLYRLEYVD